MSIRQERALLSVYDKTGLVAVRAAARRARRRADRERRHRAGARRRGDRGDPARGADGLRRAARPSRRLAPPRRARRHPRPPRRARRPRPARGPRDRADRPRLRQPLPVPAHDRPARRRLGGGDRADRHRRADPPARGREEPRARRPALPARGLRGRSSRSSASTPRSRRPPGATLAARAFQTTAALDGAVAGWLGRDEAFPETLRARLRAGPRALVRREPAPARGVLRPARRAHAPPRAGRAAPGQAALVQQPRRPLGGPAARARARRPGRGDREARESLRRGEGARRSRRRTHGLAPPIPSRRTAASSCSTGRSPPSSAQPSPSSSSRCSMRPATTRRALERARRSGRRRGCSPTTSAARFVTTERDLRRVLGGLLVQDRDADGDPLDTMDVVCGDPDEATWEELLFAWTVVKHVDSNAIVLARGGQTIGIGAGQMSRVDAVRLALDKARELGHALEGAVLASDAFFPFADGPQLALEAGVRRDHPARRLEARRRGDRRGPRRRRDDGAHRAAPLQALTPGRGSAASRSTCRQVSTEVGRRYGGLHIPCNRAAGVAGTLPRSLTPTARRSTRLIASDAVPCRLSPADASPSRHLAARLFCVAVVFASAPGRSVPFGDRPRSASRARLGSCSRRSRRG